MRKTVIIFLAILLLSGGLVSAAVMGYTGVGMASPGGPSARVGSIGGLTIIGGGPGSGK